MKQFSIAIILITSLLGGCATNALQSQKSEQANNPNKLTELKQPHFDSVMVKTLLQNSGAKRIFFADLGVDDAVIDQPYQSSRSVDHEFSLTEQDKTGLKSVFDGAITAYFSDNNGFVIVDDPEDADVIVTADILEISPLAPKDDHQSRRISALYYTEGSGNMTVEFNVYHNQQLVMKIEDTSDAGRFWEQNSKINNKQNVKGLFKSWARNLAELLS